MSRAPTAKDARARAANVRRALRALCEDARAHRVRVEQLVIAIKQGWSSLHSDNPRARSAGPDELLNHVITLVHRRVLFVRANNVAFARPRVRAHRFSINEISLRRTADVHCCCPLCASSP